MTRPVPDLSAVLTKAERDALTPAQVLDALRLGNERFRNGTRRARDYVAQLRASAGGQYPAAAIFGCVDSRVPVEILFDLGIGDTFTIRIAGNVIDEDTLGSMEFACAVAGAKLVVVLGHTACGAIQAAIDDVEMGNVTRLLDRLKPAIAETAFDGEKSSANPAYVDGVSFTNVRLGVKNVRLHSQILSGLEAKGSIRIVAALYTLATGEVEFFDEAAQ